jgi:D-alanyl-D-alanine carboxypeptidase (penicillin-binding protein 5/6)
VRAKRFFKTSGFILSLAFSWALQASPARGEPKLIAQAGILMDLHSGEVLWKKNSGERLAPASTTKILTALLAIERAPLSDEVAISERAAAAEGSRVRLVAGETVAVEDLLYGLLLASGNDAAVAIAEHVAGSVEDFAKLMTEKARSIGALHSRFRNPSGLPEDDHYTTAEDLALIARAALRQPLFREIVATRSRPWRSREWQGDLLNHNRLLGAYDGAIGIKTGFTLAAGQCLVAAAERENGAYVAVVLKSRGKAMWEDAIGLLDYGFHNYSRIELADKGDTLLTSFVNGEKVPLVAAAPVHYLVARSDPGVSRLSIVLDELGPPIAKGDKLGQAFFLSGDQEIASVDLISTAEVPVRRPLVPLMTWLGWGLVGVLGASLLLVQRRRRYFFVRPNRKLRL